MKDEQKERLKLWANDKLKTFPKELDNVRSSLKQLNKAIEHYKSRGLSSDNSNIAELENLIRLGNCRILLGFLMLDLTTAIKIYANAEFQYEEIYAVRQMIVISREGFKQLYHYIETERKDSYWMSYFKEIISTDLPELDGVFQIITKKLHNYLDDNEVIKTIRSKRNFSVHYDKDATKLYDEIKEIKLEDYIHKVVAFSNIIEDLLNLTHEMSSSYLAKFNKSIQKSDTNLEKQGQQFENLRETIARNSVEQTNAKAQALITSIQELIKNVRDSNK